MNILKKSLLTLLVAVIPVLASGQEKKGSLLKQTLEIAEVEINDGQEYLCVFDMPDGDQHNYYLSVGTLGIGSDIIQFQVDPAFQLFIPLGSTLEAAQAKLEEFRDLAKEPAKTQIETVGTLALGNPSTGTLEPVYVTSHRFLTQKIAEFSVKRNGSVRATHIARSNLSSLVGSVKIYRKIHPKEK